MTMAKIDPCRSETPLTNQNLNQNMSMRSGELLIGRNSTAANQRNPDHKGSTYKLCVSFFILFCSFLVTATSKNGSADFDDLFVKRRGSVQGSAFRGSKRFEELPRGSFPRSPQNWPGIGSSAETKPCITFQPFIRFSLKLTKSALPDN
jgi:hypothetical protein